MTEHKTMSAQEAESTRDQRVYSPPVDIYESEHEMLLFAEVPGARAEDVELRFDRGELVLQVRPPQRQWPSQRLLAEHEPGSYYRAFRIHESIDGGKIEASCKNGLLTVRLPKKSAVQPMQVPVQGG